MVPLPTKPVLCWLHGEDTKHNISLHCALVKWMHLSSFMTTELASQLIPDSAPNQCNPRISVLDIPRISDTVKSSVITHDTQVHFCDSASELLLSFLPWLSLRISQSLCWNDSTDYKSTDCCIRNGVLRECTDEMKKEIKIVNILC